MFEKCTNCNSRILAGGRRDRNGIFCSATCQSYYRQPYFCRDCLLETSPKDAGSCSSLNGCGTMLYGSGSRCEVCNSIIQTKFITLIYIPVFPLGKYRILWSTNSSYLSRKLLPPHEIPDPDDYEEGYSQDYADEAPPPLPSNALASQYQSPDSVPISRENYGSERGRRRSNRPQCHYCGSDEEPIAKRRISTTGWVLFAVFLFFCFPLFWIGLLIQEDHDVCYDCGQPWLD